MTAVFSLMPDSNSDGLFAFPTFIAKFASMEQKADHKSVYAYAAEAGPLMSLPLIVVALSMLLANKVPGAGMLALPALVAAPFVLWRLMRRVASGNQEYMSFFPLWLFGIYSMIFATLICAFFSAMYLVFVEPGFVASYFDNAISALNVALQASSGVDFSHQIEVLQAAVDNRLLPSSMELVASMSWLSAFTGSVLSAVVARATVLMRGRRSITQQR